MSERKITNTAIQAANNPILPLAEAMIFGGSHAIERSDAIGQRELVESTDLPAEGSDHPAFAAMGITFGPPHADDDIFRPAKLPDGWKKVGTDHAMWSKLVDNNGHERASIFYKAAFDDRSAHMRPVSRFSVCQNYDIDKPVRGEPRKIQHRVLDKGSPVFSTDVVTVADVTRDDWMKQVEIQKAQEEVCNRWLVDHGYSDWHNAASYWDVA